MKCVEVQKHIKKCEKCSKTLHNQPESVDVKNRLPELKGRIFRSLEPPYSRKRQYSEKSELIIRLPVNR